MKPVNNHLILTLSFVILSAACLSGCGKASTETTFSDQSDQQSQSSTDQNIPEYWLDIEDYQDT